MIKVALPYDNEIRLHGKKEVIIFRPHRSTTYVDAAYCYRPSSVVCRSVTVVSPAKTAEPIDMPFGASTLLNPGNHVLDGGPDLSMDRGQF